MFATLFFEAFYNFFIYFWLVLGLLYSVQASHCTASLIAEHGI